MNLILTSSQKRGFILLFACIFMVLSGATLQNYRVHLDLNGGIHNLSIDKPKIKSVPLDVNKADSIQLESLPGIGPKLAGRIVKYRRNSGGYKSIDQVSKIYGLTCENFEKAKPFLFVAEGFYPTKVYSRQDSPVKKQWSKTDPKVLVDINETDSLGLLEVRGVGPFLAGKIIKYRSLLGYFHSTAQLAEVRGMHTDNLEKILAQVTVGKDFSKYPHLLVNIQSGYELSAHPYLSYTEGKLLDAYRKQHGPYSDSLSFAPIKEFPDSTLKKILPYCDYRVD